MLAVGSSGAPSAGAIAGLTIIGVLFALTVALTVALFRARIRLARAETELSFLRVASPGRDAAAGYVPPAQPSASALPDPDAGGK